MQSQFEFNCEHISSHYYVTMFLAKNRMSLNFKMSGDGDIAPRQLNETNLILSINIVVPKFPKVPYPKLPKNCFIRSKILVI